MLIVQLSPIGHEPARPCLAITKGRMRVSQADKSVRMGRLTVRRSCMAPSLRLARSHRVHRRRPDSQAPGGRRFLARLSANQQKARGGACYAEPSATPSTRLAAQYPALDGTDELYRFRPSRYLGELAAHHSPADVEARFNRFRVENACQPRDLPVALGLPPAASISRACAIQSIWRGGGKFRAQARPLLPCWRAGIGGGQQPGDPGRPVRALHDDAPVLTLRCGWTCGGGSGNKDRLPLELSSQLAPSRVPTKELARRPLKGARLPDHQLGPCRTTASSWADLDRPSSGSTACAIVSLPSPSAS